MRASLLDRSSLSLLLLNECSSTSKTLCCINVLRCPNEQDLQGSDGRCFHCDIFLSPESSKELAPKEDGQAGRQSLGRRDDGASLYKKI